MQTNPKIIFIDSQVADYQILVSGVIPGIKVVILTGDCNGIEQITEALSHKLYSTVHIISHGSPGCLYLGNAQLSLDTLDQYQSELKTWFSFPPLLRGARGNLLLYGCNVAAGDAGEEFITKLHQVTGALIAASTTPIGNADLGGNWNLDITTNNIVPSIAFTSKIQYDYQGVLGEYDNPLAEDLAEDIASITTDLDDYAPGSTAYITGENFEPGETVELQILHTDGTPNTGGGHNPWLITDGGEGDLDNEANGTILTTWYVNPDDSAGSAFELTATGLNSELFANHYFTDSDPAVQFFYLPGEEEDLFDAFEALTVNNGGITSRIPVSPVTSTTSITVSTDDTILYYDHWETEGYETDISNPTQSTTEIWGDNDPNNGIPPGFTVDLLDAGDIITLESDVAVPRVETNLFFDGRDKIGASKAVVVTRTAWAGATSTLLAGAWEVFDTSKFGNFFTIPVGEDVDTDVSGSIDEIFEYVGLTITASEDSTSIDIDADGDSSTTGDITTVALNEGETHFINGGIQSGSTVDSDKPIQAHLITGNISEASSNVSGLSTFFASRWYTLYADTQWSNNYFSPVGDTNTNPTNVFIYNPNGSAITVNYQYRDGSNNLVTTSLPSIASGEVYRHELESDSGYRFYTTSDNFAAFSAVSADNSTSSNNSTYDWGHNLISDTNLNPVIVIGDAPGSDDVDDNGTPDQASYSPVWVTPVSPTRVYVNYTGDLAQGSLTDPNGNKYDEHYDLEALETVKLFDTSDNDMTGARIYTVDNTNLSGAWGQDPDTAETGSPSIDVGTAVLPFPTAYTWKEATLTNDVDDDGNVDPGDTIEYKINVDNDGVVILGNVNVSDIIPASTTYVEGTSAIAGVSIGDDGTGTAFPFDDDKIDNGFDGGRNIGSIEVGGSTYVSYDLLVNNFYDGGLDGVNNSAVIDSDEETFNVAVTTPIDFSDVVKIKTLYLSDNSGSNNLDRVDPTSGNETTDFKSIVIGETDLVGVDFDNASGFAPSNWTEILNTTTTSFSNLQDDTGTATVYDLNLTYSGTSNTGAANDTASTVPSNLSTNIDYSVFSDTGITTTWSDLDPLTTYDIYVFGLGSSAIDQDIAITGSSALTPFTQSTAAGNLFINDSVGSNTNTLESYATQVVSDASGNITIDVTPNSGNAGIAGLAIEPTSEDSITFTQSISMQSDIGMPSGQPVEITAYLDVSSGNPTTTSNITANLTYDSGANTLLNLGTPTSVGTPTGTVYPVTWETTLSDNVTIAAGETISLDITNNDSSLAFNLLYDNSSYPSKVDLPTINVINISDIGIYDAANGAGNLINSAADGETVYIRVEVEDPFGDYDITSLDLDITDPNSSLLTPVTLDSDDDIDGTTDGKRVFEYAWTPPSTLGEFSIQATAKEGYENIVTDVDTTTFTLNDGTVPDVVIGDDTVTEGTSLVFDVTLSGTTSPTTDIVLDLTTTDGTARGISDYETTNFEYSTDGGITWIAGGGTNGTEVTIPAGSSGIKVRIDSVVDTTDESDETFTLGVGSVFSGSVGNTSDTGTGTILDDDATPSISIDDVSLTEGDSNEKEFTFTVTLDNPSSETVTVDYVTNDGTATTADDDYTAVPSTTLTFVPGETSKTVTVNVKGDTTVETDQTFTVDLSSPTNATIADSQGVGTILNDDDTPIFEIDDVSLVEGHDADGTKIFTFTVTRSGNTVGEVTVDYTTADNTATTGDSDYDSISGTLTFADGETTKTISVTVNGDDIPEADDIFYVNLSNAINVTTPANGATISDSQGIGTIINDDESGAISGTVEADTNNDGTADTPLSGVTIELLDSDGNSIDSDSGTAGVQPTTTTTDSSGYYEFTGVALGSYQVQETNLSGYTDVSEVDGSTDGGDDTDSGDNGITNNIPVVLAADGEVDSGNDFVDEQVSSISGEVLSDTNNDDVGDSPLEGVTIELLNSTGSTVIATTTTNASGGYSFSDLSPGDYQVRQTNLSNYSDVKDLDTNVDGSANGAGGNTDLNLIDVSLSPGEDSTGNDFVDERGVISGTVTEDSFAGDPLANVTIELLDSSSNIVASTLTDASGNYSFTNLEPNIYTVLQTDLAGYSSIDDDDNTNDGGSDNDTNSSNTDNELIVDLAGGESDTGNDFVDEALPGSISGQVLEDTTGNGIGDTLLAGATVSLSGLIVGFVGSIITDEDGTYTFTDLVPDIYTITETNPTNYIDVNELDSNDNGANDNDLEDKDNNNDNQLTVTLALNEADTGNDFIDEAQPGNISGTVKSDVNGDGDGDDAGVDVNLENVTLSLLNELGSPVLDDSGDAITTATNASGEYTFSNIPPGNYQVVETDLSGYSSIKDEDSDADSVDDDAANSNENDNKISVTLLAGETDSGNDFIDQQNGAISGTVEQDPDGTGTNNTALFGVTVTLKDSAGDAVATVATDTNGDYSFSDLTPGDYTVEESDPTGYSSKEDADNDPDAISDDANNTETNDNSLAVTLLPNETDSGNDFVDQQNGMISGSVTADTDNDDDGDDPISGVTITLRNASDSSAVATTITDGGGNYSFSDIAPGNYTVEETNPAGYVDVAENEGGDDNDNGDNSITNSIAVTLDPGESDTGNNFVDEETGSISGIVSEDTVGGTGVAGVTITLTNTDTSATVTTTTATDGTYSFTDLVPGNYQIDETDLGTHNSLSDEDSVDDDGGASGTDNTDNDTNTGSNDNQLIVALSAGESDTGNNFVDELDTASRTISGQVLEDTDGDGVGDTPISGVLITLGGASSATTLTLSDGTYSFSNLDDGNYTLTESDLTSPTAYVSISDTDGDNDNTIAVTLSGSSTGNDFVDGLPASISGVVWEDFDANGIEGSFETDDVVSGVTVTLTGGGADGVIGTGGDDTVATTLTASDGTYSFTNLIPEEEYEVSFATPASGYSGYTSLNQGADDTIDSDADPNNSNTTAIIQLDAGENRTDVDAGLLPDTVITVSGTSSSETLNETGNSGNEVIAGFKGQDTLTGGTGNDTFFYNETSDGVDLITDFTSGEDEIDLSQILANETSYSSGNPFDQGFATVTDFPLGGAMVQIDFDGTGGSDLVKSVVLIDNLTASGVDITGTDSSDTDFIF